MNKYIDALTGFCLASAWRGMRAGPGDLARASAEAANAVKELGSPELRSIPSAPLEKILGSRKPEIRLTIQENEDGSLPAHQALILYSLLVAEQPQVVLEIGTFMGHTTRAMAMNLPEAVIHTVDLPLDFSKQQDPVSNLQKDDFHLIQKRKVGSQFLNTPQAAQIRQHFADTAEWNFREAAGATFFFIDGSHTYDYCRSDSEKCLELCEGKGTFLWHDCNDDHPGVVKFIREWRAKGREIVRINRTCVAYWKGA
jgi:hypothetical protein